ncbi:MAG: type II 3-dehydroquinate dehydratase [Prevotella sp.]|nr:type II 3-dehydroquinate dehydratase [Bacteroides sp.]MCM1366546.1 type II 3-dehydroquinate dehydratase [Prevotella sp.]MCM1436856.1 type II 3-dehydroquinate dehydratase [Prevotella sp.]
MKILVLNGPNLNLVGVREPEIYGNITLDEFFAKELSPLSEALTEQDSPLELSFLQSNCEGDLVSAIQRAGYGDDDERVDAVILNAGAYTHYSIAIADAIRAVNIPVVEVHISNIYAREEMRHHSVISGVCRGVMAGFGLDSYKLAMMWLYTHRCNF